MAFFFVSVLLFVVLAVAVFVLVLWSQERERRREAEAVRDRADVRSGKIEEQNQAIRLVNQRLQKYAGVADADAAVRQLKEYARRKKAEAEAAHAEQMRQIEAWEHEANVAATARVKELKREAEAALTAATARAAEVTAEAQRRARDTAGKAFDAVENAALYERTARAMQNLIEGYGDAYLVPAQSLLDDLADDFSHEEAGRRLKIARQHTRSMIETGAAAKCDYVDPGRRVKAEHFVLDAFNGKVDSILIHVKHDNVGKLQQEIKDAFTTVNFHGKAFRNARIDDTYLDARLEELRWGSVTQTLRQRHQEEQRQIRERIREEEKARREYERAIKEAAKQEQQIEKALDKLRAQAEAAGDAQRERYEQKLAELQGDLRAAQERNLRATSMAQHTRRGHVYVISNVGSFGEGVYKVGLTRRLEPLDRVKELGDASVPFEFDVHAMLFSDDAPALEARLHKHLLRSRVNKVNHRKEFFRADLTTIRGEVETLGLAAQWTMAAEAQHYRETLAIERRIAEDPQALAAWESKQLVLESSLEDEEELVVTSSA